MLGGAADQSIRFHDICTLLRRLGFDERHRGGSHHIFVRHGIAEIMNLQPRSDGTAKPYQVRQVRSTILKFQLHMVDEGE